MIIREQIDQKYKELYGRKANKKSSDETILAKIHELEPEFNPVEEKQPELAESEIKHPEIKEEIKNPAEKPVTPSTQNTEPSDEYGNPLKKGKLFLLYVNGVPKYYTKSVVKMAFKQYRNGEAVLPENSPYEFLTRDNKCIDC